MRKIFALLLALIMCFGLIACSEEIPIEVETVSTVSTSVPETTVGFVPSPEGPPVTTDPIFVFETEDVIYHITNITYDEIFECYNVNMYIENLTDYEIWVGWENVSVNDYIIDPFFGCSIPAGKKMNTSTSFYQTILDENGIANIEAIEFALNIYYFTDPENWEGHTILSQDIYKIEF